MSVPARLAAFAALVLVAFGLGAAAGEVVGPIDTGSPTEHHEEHS